MLVSVTVMFAVSWLPIQVILLLKAFEMFDVTVTNISLQVKIEKKLNIGNTLLYFLDWVTCAGLQ